MKLVIIIPCLNEEKTLPLVLKSIPKKIEGITKIEVVVIDDGSTDKTVKVAKNQGVKHFVIHQGNKGLARSFADGLNEALRIGADIIVNTDGDNQYPQEDIPRLIKPILDNKADMVIADRQTHTIKYFPLYKKILQKFGSAVVCQFAGIKVPDAVSGFRAYSRETAMRLNVFTDYTYTIETLIQAGKRRKRIAVIKIKTRSHQARKSRLIHNIPQFIKISGSTILRVFAIYEPLKVFSYIGLTLAFPGIFFIFRFIFFYIIGKSNGHIQSLIIGSVAIIVGVGIGLLGIVADLIAINRKMNEEILYRLKNQDQTITFQKIHYMAKAKVKTIKDNKSDSTPNPPTLDVYSHKN